MKQTAFIFGAGKTGRGFAAHLAHLSGYQIILVDKDQNLVDHLNNVQQYTVEILGVPSLNHTIYPEKVFHISDNWIPTFTKSHLVFISVFGNNLEELAAPLSKGLAEWLKQNPEPLNLITCENFTHAARFLKEKVSQHLNQKEIEELNRRIGFSESLILRTCLSADMPDDLTVRAQNFFELPCDGDAFKGDIPNIKGLKPLKKFGHQLQRKIYTYNCINAVITYLGAEKGYTQLYEAGNDPEILIVARKAAEETCEAQVIEYGFDPYEQKEWMDAAFSKFADKAIPDPIDRNGADPARKLSRNDRLIGPATLAIKHGIKPDGLIKGILAGFKFHDDKLDYSISSDIKTKGLDQILMDICGLQKNERLFELIKESFEG